MMGGSGNSHHRLSSEAREHTGLVFGEVLFPLGPLDFSGDLAVEAFGFDFRLLVGLLGGKFS